MHCWKVLVADDNISFLDMLVYHINEQDSFRVVCTAMDGEAALEGVLRYMPDVVVLDMIMPKMDGLAVQEKIAAAGIKPKIVIFSALGMDYITKQSLAMGADAYFIKPFNIDLFLKRLRMLMGESREELAAREQKTVEDDLEQRIGEMLHKLAVAPHLLGYKYLKSAILCVVKDRGMLEAITLKIYPEVARQHETTPSRVERAMRNAVENAWDRCRVETMEQVFGYSLDENKGKPSNSEFIAMIADKVLLDSSRRV